MQTELFHESALDALKSAISALGGAKKVACQIRPAQEPDRAQRWLANALDDSRPEKLEVEDVIWILREAKRIGFHQAMQYIAQECEYDARPIEPSEAEAETLKIINNASQTLARALSALERLNGSKIKAVK